MPDKLWKRHERRTAMALGGTRIPVDGRGGQPDVRCDLFAVECKTRRRPLRLLELRMGQAIAATHGAQIPLLVLHTTGRRHADDYVVMRLADWCDLNGPILAAGEE